MDDKTTIRSATPDDAAQIALHRSLMFNELRERDPEILTQLKIEFEAWVKERLQTGQYFGWLALNAFGDVVGGVGVWVQEWPPHPGDFSRQRGHVMDVYVRPIYRRRGIARQLLQVAVARCKEEGLRTVTLAASHMARPLYEELGFESGNIMRIKLK